MDKEKLKRIFTKKKNDKETALIKLILWIIFILIIFIIVKISSLYS